MNQPWIAVIAVCCNALAQLAMKLAGNAIDEGARTQGILAWAHPLLLVAIVLYGSSFLLTVKVFAANNLIVAGPLMAGGAFVLVAILGVTALGETLTPTRALGMFLILAGIMILGRSA